MKKLFVKIGILFVMLCTGVIIIFLLPLPEHSFNAAIIDKHQLLEKTESPRIILVGGSNVFFGIDSAAIRSRFNIPVVNLGVNAGFGLGRILDDALPFLHPGDILIIIPEYDHFIGNWNGGAAAYELIFDFGQKRLLLSPHYRLPKGFIAYLATHLKGAVIGYLPTNVLAYTKDGVNEYGDYVKHLTKENQFFIPAKNIGAINQADLVSFFRFIDDFTTRGITVALSYPSYEEQSFRNSAGVIAELDAAFRSKENLLVISTPDAYCFPTNFFYDTVYHLNAEGRTRRTKQLLEDLQASGLLGGGS